MRPGRGRVCLGTSRTSTGSALHSLLPMLSNQRSFFFFLGDRISSIPGWPQTFYVARDALELLVLHIPSADRCGPPHLVSVMLGKLHPQHRRHFNRSLGASGVCLSGSIERRCLLQRRRSETGRTRGCPQADCPRLTGAPTSPRLDHFTAILAPWCPSRWHGRLQGFADGSWIASLLLSIPQHLVSPVSTALTGTDPTGWDPFLT